MEYQPLSCDVSAQSCNSVFSESLECFVCRDVELLSSDPLRNFCDCKTLLAHHVCLSTWIQRGQGSEDRLRCVLCRAKYQLQRNSPWLSVSFQWQTWLVLITVSVLVGLVPYVVHCMMTAFNNPPPPRSFKVAAASFGLLTEILLIKCLASYLSARYRRAKQSSFTVQARDFEADRTKQGHRETETTSAGICTQSPSGLAPQARGRDQGGPGHKWIP
ncbi:uncharacterized protein LOC143007171 [Genypterus blacodes]|uniref:uncharacterized protein LOC143007171 n=1 Tax=Genypterus blacodes TaxID=154954 RepID=UPI003F765E4A